MARVASDAPPRAGHGSNGAGTVRLREAADLVGVSTVTLRRWANAGKVPCSRSPGGQRRFRRQDLETVLESCERPETEAGRSGHGARRRRARPPGQARAGLLRELVELGTLSTQTHDVDSLLQVVAERLLVTLDIVDCDIYKLQQDGRLCCIVSVDRSGRDPSVEGAFIEPERFGPAQLALDTRQIVVAASPGAECLTRRDRDAYARNGFASEAAVPLVASDQTVGLLEVYDHRQRDYSEYLDFLKSAAQIVGGALEGAVLLARLDESNRDLELLVRSGLEFSATLEFDEVLRLAAMRMCAAAAADFCDIYTLEGEALRAVASVKGAEVDTSYAGLTFSLADDCLGRLVVESRRPVAVPDIERDERLTESQRCEYRRWDMRSTLILPLMAGGRVVGTAELCDGRPREFEGIELLQGLANLAAQAISNARLHRAREQHETRLASVLDASRAISSSLVLERALDTVARKVADALNANECVIFAYEKATDTITACALYQTEPTGYELLGQSRPLSGYPLGRRIFERASILVEGISDPDLDPASRASMEEWGEKSCLTVPLMFGGEPVGMLVVSETANERQYTPEELELVTALGEHAAVALHNARTFQSLQEQNAELARRARHMALVNESSAALSSTLDLHQVLVSTAARLSGALDVPNCDVYTIEGDGTIVCVVSVIDGEVDEAWQGKRFLLDEWAPMKLVMASRAAVALVPDDPRLSGPALESMRAYGQTAMLVTPLIANDAVIGAVELYEDRAPRAFSKEEIDLVEAICRVAAMAIDNAGLYHRQDERNRQLTSMLESSRAVTSSLLVTDVLGEVARSATKALGSAYSVIWEYDREGQRLVEISYASAEGKADGYVPDKILPVAEVPRDYEILQGGRVVEETISDPDLHPASRQSMEREGEKTCLSVPLVFGDDLMGLLILVETERERHFTQQECELATALGEQAAVALHNAKLFESLQKSNEELEMKARREALVNESSLELSSSLELGEVLLAAAQRMSSILDVTGCEIYSLEGPDGLVCMAATVEDAVDAGWSGSRFGLDEWPASRLAVESGAAVAIGSLDDPRLGPEEREVMRQYGEKSVLIVPLVAKDRVIGTAELTERRCERVFTAEDIATAQSLGRMTALAMDNARLFERLELRGDEMALLNQIARRVSASLDISEIAAATLDELAHLAPYDRAGLLLIDGAGRLDEAYASSAERSLQGVTLSDVDPKILEQLEHDSVVLLDLPGEAPLPEQLPSMKGLRSAIAIGLFGEQGLMGAFVIGSAAERAYAEVDRRVLEGVGAHASLAIKNARLYENVRTMHLGNLRALSSALNAKDYYTLGHTARVATYAVLLARELGWSPAAVDRLEEVAYLHDVGKIAVSDRILLKAGPLTDDEWRMMQEHPVISAEIISALMTDELVAGVRHHHERYDGSGYPDGLKGDDIPQIARLLCVVDSYDAMSSRRLYKEARTYTDCLAELERCKGDHFDPVMVDAFCRVLKRLADLKRRAERVAMLAAARIDADKHALLRESDDMARPEYAEILGILREALQMDSCVATLGTSVRFDEQRMMSVVDADPEQDRFITLGEMLLLDEEEAELYAGHRLDSNVVYVDAWGTWVCGLAPILGRDHSVVGIVSADVAAVEYDEIVSPRSEINQSFAALARSAATRLTRVEIDAVTDSLSGLYNHRYLHERLAEEAGRTLLQGSELSLLFIDIDRFKNINDNVGHSIGDEIIRRVAHIVGGAVRRIDVAARYGGDEFAVLLVGTGTKDAMVVAERIRTSVENARLAGDESALTVSIGVAALPADAQTKTELIENADAAMYRAKGLGRNRCVPFNDEPLRQDVRGERAAPVPEYLTLMARLADDKAMYVGDHSDAVAALAAAVAMALGMSEAQAREVGEAARLRDIGQLTVPDRILQKPDGLSAAEWELVREHPVAGERLLRRLTGLDALAKAIGHHHESFDGSGYPRGLKESEIPLASRIIAVVSAYHAMLADRPYRPSMPVAEALGEVQRGAGTQFDPEVVAALERVLAGGSDGA